MKTIPSCLESAGRAVVQGTDWGAALKRILMFTWAEFAIRRFESWRPSHTVLLFWHVGRLYRKALTFRALARTDSVSDAY